MRYKFCPICGTKLIEKAAGDDGNVPFCEKCSEFWFDSFASCCIVLVANELDEIALLRESHKSDKYSTLVSGYIIPGETAEECAFREVEEEIGVKLESLEYSGTYWFAKRELLMHGFIGRTDKCDLILSEEVDSAEWASPEKAGETLFPDFPGNAARALYRKFMNEISR